jgi:anti-anti-sigma factor
MVERVVELESQDGVLVARLRGELDAFNVPDVEPLLAAIPKGEPLIVSLEQCRYCDTSVLGALVRLHKSRPNNLAIVFSKGSIVERVFDIAQLSNWLRTYRSVEAAVRAFHPDDPQIRAHRDVS